MDVESSTYKSLNALSGRLLPVGIALLWVAAYFTTFVDLWARWIQWDSALAHGIPVLAIFFYLLWNTGKWNRCTFLSPALEASLSAVALLGCSLLWFVAYAVNIQIIEQLLLLPLLVLVYGLVFGWRTVSHHRILLLILIFSIPVWGSLNDILLDASSAVVGSLVRAAEMPALIQGNSIYIPYGHILIADGCSGLRYFVIALALAYLIGYLNDYREGRIALLIAIAAILALITNWIRIFLLIVIGYKTEMQSSLMSDHELFGWLLFGAIFLPAIYFAPVKRRVGKVDTSSAQRIKPALLLVGALTMSVGPVAGMALRLTYEPSVGGGDVDRILPGSANSDTELPAKMNAPPGGATSVRVLPGAIYLREDIYYRLAFNDKLVPYLPRLYDHQYWSSVDHSVQRLSFGQVHYLLLQRKGSRERVAQVQWFSVGDRTVATSLDAKLWQIPATLKGQNRFEIVTLQKVCTTENCQREKVELSAQAEAVMETVSE